MKWLPGACLAAALLAPPAVRAAELHVVSSYGFAEADKALATEFERQTGNKIILELGPSMGETASAIPQRLERHEDIDVLTMVGYALDKLVAQGKVDSDAHANIARSLIGAVVKQGAPVPDISTVDKLRDVLLAAPSIAISDSASGVYIQKEMFKKLGIEDQVRGKTRVIPGDPVAGTVARGEAAIGFQQISELKPVQGVTILGPLPAEVQDVTIYAAGVVASSQKKDAALALLHFLASPAAAAAITNSGMEPFPPPK
jgi:molybdate transport system substrate-binding protein